jgi:hypothetical protein
LSPHLTSFKQEVREGEKLTAQFPQVQFTVRYWAVKSCRASFGLDSIEFLPKMANNKIGSNSSSKSEGKSAGNGEVAEPKKTLASRKSIRLGTLVWAKLDGWPWWPGKSRFYIKFYFFTY